jgi:hypothetical protein
MLSKTCFSITNVVLFTCYISAFFNEFNAELPTVKKKHCLLGPWGLGGGGVGGEGEHVRV